MSASAPLNLTICIIYEFSPMFPSQCVCLENLEALTGAMLFGGVCYLFLLTVGEKIEPKIP